MFKTNKTNSKQTWSILSQIIKKSKKSNTLPSTCLINGSKISHPLEIAEAFNEFFSKIGQNVSDNVPNHQSNYSTHIKGHFPDTFHLTPIDPIEILKTARKLKPKLLRGMTIFQQNYSRTQ
jgi:hypothetical protein